MLYDKIKTINWKDLGMRALWTFIEAFLAVIVTADYAGLASGDAKKFLVALALSAVAAGLSALKTLVKDFLFSEAEENINEEIEAEETQE